MMLNLEHHGVTGGGVAPLVVVPSEEVPTVLLPVLTKNILNAHLLHSKHLKPSESCPDSILLPDVIASRSEALFSTQANLSIIQQVSKVLPASRCIEAFHPLLLSHQVHGATGGHRPGEP